MSTVVLVLKIIGLVLLAILCLLVFLALCLLFVPVRYRIFGEAEDGLTVRVRAGWLLHTVTFCGAFQEGEWKQKLRVLGIPAFRKKKSRRLSRIKAGRGQRKKEEPPAEEAFPGAEETFPGAEEAFPGAEETITHPEKKGVFQKFRELKRIPGMIRAKLENLKEKAGNLKETLSVLKETWKDEKIRAAVKMLLGELRYLSKHLAPERIRAAASFSLGNPADTGLALGIVSMIPAVYRYEMHLSPDFFSEQPYFKGSFDIKGAVYGIHLLILLIHIMKDKNIRQLIRGYHNS